MIKQLAHICIGATDLAESRRFYCEILGMDKVFDFIKEGELYGFYIGLGGMTFIEIFMQEEAANDKRPIVKHLCLEVDDLDALIASVRSKGWEISEKKMGSDHTWQSWITDPAGVQIELQQYTDDSTQITGEDCIVDW